MPNISNQDAQLVQSFWTSSATQQEPLGQRGWTQDGRAFHYCGVGGVDLVAGNIIQAPAIITTHLATTAVATGASSVGSGVSQAVTFTPGGTGGAANLYSEGYLNVDTTPGNGYIYSIRDHLAITASTAFTLNLLPDDPVQIALTTASRLGVLHNRFTAVIQAPITTATGTVSGVAPYIIKTLQYGWLQTWGVGSVLINGTPALGAAVVSPSATTAGSVDVITTTNLVTAQVVGYMAQIGVSGKNNFVDLKIHA